MQVNPESNSACLQGSTHEVSLWDADEAAIMKEGSFVMVRGIGVKVCPCMRILGVVCTNVDSRDSCAEHGEVQKTAAKYLLFRARYSFPAFIRNAGGGEQPCACVCLSVCVCVQCRAHVCDVYVQLCITRDHDHERARARVHVYVRTRINILHVHVSRSAK